MHFQIAVKLVSRTILSSVMSIMSSASHKRDVRNSNPVWLYWSSVGLKKMNLKLRILKSKNRNLI